MTLVKIGIFVAFAFESPVSGRPVDQVTELRATVDAAISQTIRDGHHQIDGLDTYFEFRWIQFALLR